MLCGLEGSGFIVAIGLTLLVSGVVVYYCNSRLNSMETSIRNQNKVLGDFIAHVQEEIVSDTLPGGGNNPFSGGSPASGGANKVHQIELGDAVLPADRISVSDDSGSESESESETDSGSESESDGESEVEPNNDSPDNASVEASVDPNDTVSSAETKLDVEVKAVKDVELTPQKDTADKKVIMLNENDSESDSDSDSESDSDNESESDGEHDFRAMKVPQLRELVVKKNLVATSGARSLKKAALITLLEDDLKSKKDHVDDTAVTTSNTETTDKTQVNDSVSTDVVDTAVSPDETTQPVTESISIKDASMDGVLDIGEINDIKTECSTAELPISINHANEVTVTDVPTQVLE